jgi:decaprenylphospho-beta-D-ribofuranose 2-oxidase
MGETATVRGWGGATASHSTLVRPIDDPQWHDLLAKAGPRGVIARGGGCGYGDAAQNGGGVVALTIPAGGLREVHVEDGTVVADAGTRLGDLVRALAPLGWTLPVVPGTGRVTVGGAIAADVHGKNHVRHGTFGAHVVELCVLTPGLGPLTVSPVDRPEVFWATVGGLGLTGVIRQARLGLIPLDSWLMRTRDTVAADLPALLTALRSAAETHPYAVGWIDARRGGGLVTTAEPVLPRRGVRAGDARRERRPHLPALPGPGLGWPPLTAAANRARRIAARSRPQRQEPLPAVLFPLDGVPDWPALHGRRGLVQYQFTVPFGAENVLAEALTATRRAGRPATLAAVKVFAAANPGPLSFPQPGWSLALDFPADPALGPVLDDLDGRVAAAGGRVYLVKDSRLRPDLLGAMYPDLARWQAERAVLDPDGVMVSDLARRLDLMGAFHG